MRQGSAAFAWGSLAAISVMWGSSYLLIRLATFSLPPFAIVAGRATVAAIALGLVGAWLAHAATEPAKPESWWLAVFFGTINGWLPNVLIALGLTRIDTALTGILGAASPIFTVLIAHFAIAEERLRPLQAFGVIIGFLGVALIIGVDVGSVAQSDLLGQLLIVASALCYAIGTVFGRQWRPTDVTRMAFRQNVVAGAGAIAISSLLEQPWGAQPEPLAIGCVLALGLFSTAIPAYLYWRLLQTTGAVYTSLVSYLIPVTALALGVLALHEPINPIALAGLALVLTGIWLTSRR